MVISFDDPKVQQSALIVQKTHFSSAYGYLRNAGISKTCEAMGKAKM